MAAPLPGFARRSPHALFRPKKGVSPEIDAIACHAQESGHPSPALATLWIPACSGMTRRTGAIPSERALFAGRFGHGRLGFDGDLSIIIEDFKRARYSLSLSFKRMQAYILA